MPVNFAFKQSGHSPHAAALIAVSMVALLSACRRAEVEHAPEIRPVRTMIVETRDSSGAVVLVGTVRAQTEVNESFRIDGRLVERAVDIGDEVSPGQFIARLDPQNEELGLLTARAVLASAVAQQVERKATSPGCATWLQKMRCRAPRTSRPMLGRGWRPRRSRLRRRR